MTTLYDTFDGAEELVGDTDVLEYRKESRSSKKNTRLILDLVTGDLPPVIEGCQIRNASQPVEQRGHA